MQSKIVGIAWYRPETYARLITMFEDGEKLHRTYEDWLVDAERARKSYEVAGIKVVCVDIDPDKFPKWCIENGHRLNAKARSDYANIVACYAETGGIISVAVN
jgi:hypothetical protein